MCFNSTDCSSRFGRSEDEHIAFSLSAVVVAYSMVLDRL